MQLKSFEVKAIGEIGRNGNECFISINESIRPALKAIDKFSHIIVIWWASELDSPDYRKILECDLPYAPGVSAGIFATRSPIRPNPVMFTVCKIQKVNLKQGQIVINNIDAYEGSPVLDLKVYFPSCERVEKVVVAEWAKEWGDWYPEAGLEVEDYGPQE